MTDKNSKDLAKQPDVDGFLVGGASLKPACKFPLPLDCHLLSVSFADSKGKQLSTSSTLYRAAWYG